MLLRTRFYALAILLSLTLCACASKDTMAPEMLDEHVSPTPTIEVPSIPEEDTAPCLSISQALEKALLNEMPFVCTYQTYDPIKLKNIYLSEITKEDQNTMSPPQFAVVDMDGDGTPEVVYQRSDYRGFIILRYKEGNIYGYTVNYRGLLQLKKDGSFRTSDSAFEHSMGKMRFLSDFYDMDVKLYAVGQDYYLHGESIDQSTFEQLWAEYEEVSDVDWHEYTEDMVRQWLPYDLELLEAPMWPTPTDMQVYLESLAGLLYTIDGTSGVPILVWTVDRQSYYDGWNQAMDEIYALCLEKLNDADKNALIAEQQQWLTVRSQTTAKYSEATNETLYSRLGDMTKNRTYRLISLYFDEQYYD